MRFRYHSQLKASFEVFALHTVIPCVWVSVCPSVSLYSGKSSLLFGSYSFSLQHVVTYFMELLDGKQSEYDFYENINLKSPVLGTLLLLGGLLVSQN